MPLYGGMLSLPIAPHGIRCFPLKVDDAGAKVFAQMVQSINFDLIERTIHLKVMPSSDPLFEDLFWGFMEGGPALQIDFHGQRGETVSSIVALECKTIAHSFTARMYDDDCIHDLTFRYRQHVRFGANGDLHQKRGDGASDADAILAKMIFKTHR